MSEFVDYLAEVLAPFGSITTRRMFGGHGVYHQGLMFALVANESLYFKTDADNRAEFERAGCVAFEYAKDGERVRMSYYSAPAEVFDDGDAAKRWAGLAFEAALRSRARRRATAPQRATTKARRPARRPLH